MKKCFLLLFCVCSLNAYAQTNDGSDATEQETKDFIVSKLNLYKNDNVVESHVGAYYGFKFYFDDCYFVIEYFQIKDLGLNKHNIQNWSDPIAYRYKIPVYALSLIPENTKSMEELQCVGFRTGSGTYPPKLILGIDGTYVCYCALGCISIEELAKGIVYPHEFIDWQREENLFQRVQKAFEHLKKFCPKPVSKDKF